MVKKYFPQQFEKSWIEFWDKNSIYKTKNLQNKKNKLYTLSMFPYPSGTGLHVGHVRIYTGTDVLARYFRMRGYSILHPMGWDAFGLPAENAAIKLKKNPMDIVPKNIGNFKKQMMTLGLSYDWKKEFATTDPDYYLFTQWLFIQFFKMGLLYKKDTPINYCPSCKTGLAEEEVLSNGTHERCGKRIVKKDLPQWIFRITAYANRLLEDLKLLEWPRGILEMQKNWIGKKEGIDISYKVIGTKEKIVCFTTRPDTNFGATFIVVAPEHNFVKKILSRKIQISAVKKKEVETYVNNSLAKTDIDRIAEGKKKTGVFTGFYALNNLNGRNLPIWISDFVLPSFGTGAVVGVPAHDRRDFQFAKRFGIDIIRVVAGEDGDTSPIIEEAQVQEEEGKIINSQFLNGMNIRQAIKKISNYLEKKGWGKKKTSYHLRDWIFSRQRYWGEPIPFIYCSHCARKKVTWQETEEAKKFNKNLAKNLSDKEQLGKLSQFQKNKSLYGWFPLKEENLPLKLPYVKNYQPNKKGKSPLEDIPNWSKTECPICGKEAKRETDTMPNWAGSCWYFLAFPFWDKVKKSRQDFKPVSFDFWKQNLGQSIQRWMAVDWYLGGAEHAVLHLLYARFWVKALQDLGLLNFPEPFLRLRNVGMVLAKDHRKMSKSLGNVINPNDVVAEYGADSLRMYEMFMAPFNQEISWSISALQGVYRFLKRIWRLYQKYENKDLKLEKDSNLKAKLYQTVVKVGRDIEKIKFNTAIASMMEFVNCWEKMDKKTRPVFSLSVEDAKKFLKLLAPFAPFITEEIWQNIFREKNSIHLSSWPIMDKVMVKNAKVVIPVQVNSKIRGVVEIHTKELDNEAEVIKKAKGLKKVKKYLKGKKYRMIYIKGKIISFSF